MDVSIIMPAFNGEKFLRSSIDGVLSQHFDGFFELLISDDFSNDNTTSIIKEYQRQYPSIVKLFEHNTKLGYANYAFLAQHAQGKYLAFCDQDDLWIDNMKLQQQFDWLESHPSYGMVCSDFYSIDEFGEVIAKNSPTVDFHSMIYAHSDIIGCTIMARTNLFIRMMEESSYYLDNNSFFDQVWAYWFAFYSNIYCIPKALSSYRVLDESGCHTKDSLRRYQYDKRYFQNKAYFLLQNNVQIYDKIDVLLNEYDYLYKNAKYEGEQKVRDSKSYRIGKWIIKCVCLKK